jgi:hypothetical protein
MSSDTVFFVFIFFSLAVIGGRKMWQSFDSDEKVKKSAQKWLTIWLKR